eukprot:TRINITY_DN11451_c0_g3_i1.p1 TRINITY_DN11451_c0_g3~~TRINITY_DN11451_c0_g3_i1.p1  ORF type:complete len:761 (-),score=97.63 TRINITY_DN11451_c0_g3_i1:102-2054(-)
MPTLVFTWTVVLAADCEANFSAFESYCGTGPAGGVAAKAMAKTLSTWFSWVLFLFLVATSTPLFAEIWMERSLKIAFTRLAKQYLTLSFLMFVFQAKIIGFYVINELRYGGASYVATGRGLPTDRRQFIAELNDEGTGLKQYGGLYLDYALMSYYDAMILLGQAILVLLLGGMSSGSSSGVIYTWIAIGITFCSWLYGPFVFNPYQFKWDAVRKDVTAWYYFFFEDAGKHWVGWYTKFQLKPAKRTVGFRESVVGFNIFLSVFCLATWFAIVNNKLNMLTIIYSADTKMRFLNIISILPPVISSLLFCVFISLAEEVLNCPRTVKSPGDDKRKIKERRDVERGDSSSSSDSSGSEDEALTRRGEAVVDEAPVHRRATDTVVEPPTRREAAEERGCKLPESVPLAISAIVVTVLEVAEAFAPLSYVVYGTGWRRTLVAALVLKYLLYGIVLFVAEGLLRSRCYDSTRAFLQPLNLWVHANRMFRDMLCSAFILLTLSPFVLVNSFNDFLCPGFNFHQLLIYRDPGHLFRQEAVIGTCAHHSESDEDSDGMPLAATSHRPSAEAIAPAASVAPSVASTPPLATMQPMSGTGGSARAIGTGAGPTLAAATSSSASAGLPPPPLGTTLSQRQPPPPPAGPPTVTTRTSTATMRG